MRSGPPRPVHPAELSGAVINHHSGLFFELPATAATATATTTTETVCCFPFVRATERLEFPNGFFRFRGGFHGNILQVFSPWNTSRRVTCPPVVVIPIKMIRGPA